MSSAAEPVDSRNSPRSQPSLIVVVLGPTASGKTSLAIDLALELGAEILSCDSVAVYRELEVGTAKPTAAQRAQVPHHLLDLVSPNQPYTAGDYSRDARRALADLQSRSTLPVVAGGTGLYLRALLEGLFPGPKSDEALRERLRSSAARHSAGHLSRILRRLDPVAAQTIHSNDTPKLIRAIEVALHTKQPISDAWKLGRDPLLGYRIIRIGLDPSRDQLYARINARAEKMFDEGLPAETATLIRKYGPDCRPLGSLGYKQAAELLYGRLSREQAIAETAQAHRQYAKRQLTWFRREPEVFWLNGFGDSPEIVAAARAHLIAQRG